MKYTKLVRDKIPQIVAKKGAVARIHVASDDEYYQKLKEKLFEEVEEFNKEGDEEELADVLEVVYAILDFKKIKRGKFELIRKKKVLERGAFKKRIILDEIIQK
jgi:predicted house-cleaning noncanonical NTP pyrophosphatase (MazG superfamily)